MQSKSKFEVSSIVFAIVAGLVAVFMFAIGNHDVDILWHSKVGEYIMTHSSFPRTDVFSWIGAERGSQYTCHSWAFGVLIYMLDRFLPIEAVSMVLVFSGAFAMFLLAKNTIFRGRHATVLVLSIVVGMLSSNPRPQLLSLPLLFLTLLLFQRVAEGANKKNFFFLLPIGIAWANFHGGMVPVFLGISLFYSAYFLLPKFSFFGFSFRGESNAETIPFKDRVYTSAMSISLPILSTLANPYFHRIVTYGFLENTGDVKRYIGEWQAGTIGNLFAIIPIIAIVLYFATKKKGEFEPHKVVPVVCCLIAGSVYGRFLLHAFVASLFLLPSVLSSWKKKPWGDRSWAMYSLVTVPILALLFFVVLVPVTKEKFVPLTMDSDTVSFLRGSNFLRMYNSHNEGALLLYENLPTFIDSRFTDGEVMVNGILANNMSWKDMDFDGFLEKYSFDAFLINKRDYTALEKYLRVREDFCVAFEGDHFVVFVPTVQ